MYDDDLMHITIPEEGWQDIVINEQLQIHVIVQVDGISVDYYKYRSPEEETDDYDDDFMGSRYFLWEDFED